MASSRLNTWEEKESRRQLKKIANLPKFVYAECCVRMATDAGCGGMCREYGFGYYN